MRVCPLHERMQQSLRLIELITCVMSSYPSPNPTPTSLKAPGEGTSQTTTCTTGTSTPSVSSATAETAVFNTDDPDTCHGRNRQSATLSRNCTSGSARSVALAYHDLFPSSKHKLNHLHIFHDLWYGTPRKAPRKGSGDAKPLTPCLQFI